MKFANVKRIEVREKIKPSREIFGQPNDHFGHAPCPQEAATCWWRAIRHVQYKMDWVLAMSLNGNIIMKGDTGGSPRI